jgi:hypothetical protein
VTRLRFAVRLELRRNLIKQGWSENTLGLNDSMAELNQVKSVHAMNVFKNYGLYIRLICFLELE